MLALKALGLNKPLIKPTYKNKLETTSLHGFLLCPRCNRTLTGSGSNGNGGVYYYCSGGRKERVNEAFFELLRVMSMNEKGHKTYEAILMDYYYGNNSKERKGRPPGLKQSWRPLKSG